MDIQPIKEIKVSNLKAQLSEFFNSDLCISNDMTIAHYSYGNEKEGLKHYESIGKAFLTLISTHLSISANLNEERNWDVNTKCIKKYLIKKYSNKLLLSELYNYVLFGPSVSEKVKKEENILSLMFTIVLGQLVANGNFQKLYLTLSDANEYIQIDSESIDFKTILHEYLQKSGYALPKYESLGVSGLKHEQLFQVKIFAAGISSFGEGRSKKKGETDAAKKLYKKLDSKYSVPTIKLKGTSYSFIKENLKKHSVNFNENVYKKLGISTKVNLMPALIHPRMKSHGFWGNSSQRCLAMLGAHLLDLVISLYAFKKLTKGEINDHNRASLANEILANNKLAEIYTTGFFNIGKLPFKHDDLDSKLYKVDCVQGVAAISFLNLMEADNLQAFFETDFVKWLQRRADFICSQELVSLRSNASSLAVERLGSLGLIYEFHKYEDMLGVKLSIVNGGEEFDYYPSSCKETKKEQKTYLSSVFLKGIDAYEGIGLTGKELSNSRVFFQEVAKFLDMGMVEKGKKYALENQLVIENFDINKCHEYSDFDYEELVDTWNNSLGLSLDKKIELLIRIRIFLGINKSISEAKYFAYLPIIFEEYFSEDNSKSILDFSQDIQVEKLDELSTDIAEESINEPELPKDSLNINKFKNKIEPNKNSTSSFNKITNKPILSANVTPGNETYILLDNCLKTMKCKPLSILENMWKHKESMMKSKEEAAILLAQLRYERGIDFSLLGYKTFIKSELITNLDLPSLFNTKISEKPYSASSTKVIKKSSTKPSQVNIEKQQFNLKVDDEREFSLKKVATRKGQAGFRKTLLDEWGNCCISGCNINSILEAAHIAPYRGDKDNHIQNGLILRVDIHRLFDSYMIGINPDDFTIELCPELKESEYKSLEGKKLENGDNLSNKALHYRWQYFINNTFNEGSKIS
jgi:dsRNA-specific ribonuclease